MRVRFDSDPPAPAPAERAFGRCGRMRRVRVSAKADHAVQAAVELATLESGAT
jgi:hypothetical protein